LQNLVILKLKMVSPGTKRAGFLAKDCEWRADLTASKPKIQRRSTDYGNALPTAAKLSAE
jgi:hypothetical protein